MAGVVLDMEGVLHVDWQVLPGAAEAVDRLLDAGYAVGVLTNATTRSRAAIAEGLAAMAIPLGGDRIVTAAWASGEHLRRTAPAARVLLLAEPGTREELEGLALVDEEPIDVVVVGGPDASFTYERLDLAFRALHGGASLLAMHQNRWWVTRRGPTLDAGAYVRGLAYAAGVRPRVIGKPSPRIFRIACDLLGERRDACVMVGDDLRADVLPAQRAGMHAVLVRTGKGARAAREDPRAADADAVLDSVAELPAWLDRQPFMRR